MENNNMKHNEMKVVDFQLLIDLAAELSIDDDYPINTVIEWLSMGDILMSDAVIKLGIVSGALLEGYKNNCPEE